ncbi:collagen alpha-1(XI) chain-like isoform X1 [Syngnathus scovelli]|uniref:collagen alpha-1(XI) chain-like isoform X1 n=1 Tax=Syngnathus scovelli TaxID=161590 RepID=UPI0035CAFC59
MLYPQHTLAPEYTMEMLSWWPQWTLSLLGLSSLCWSTSEYFSTLLDYGGDSGSGMLHTDEVDILLEFSIQSPNSPNTSMTMEDGRCPVLQVGQYSVLALPLTQLFIEGFADEFSLLMQLKTPQRVESSVFTMLNPDNHIMLQLRISAFTIILTGAQQRHYEFPIRDLTDGQWHHVAISVSGQRVAIFVDCTLLESVEWVNQGLGIKTDGLFIIGGIIEGFETPFEGHLRQFTFLMNNPDAARQHCTLHPPDCGGDIFKALRSQHNSALEILQLPSDDLSNLMGLSEDELNLILRGTVSLYLGHLTRENLPNSHLTLLE